MPRAFKILAGLVAALVVLALVAVALPFLVDLNRFKGPIQNAVSQHLNARLEFKSIRLTVLPWPGARLRGLSLVNTDPEFSGTPTLKVKEADFRFNLRELLRKRVVGTLRFKGTEFAYLGCDGRSNLTALARTADTASGKSPPKLEKKGKPAFDLQRDFMLEEFSFRDGVVKVKDVQGKASSDVGLRNVDLEVTNIGVDRDVKVRLDLNVDAKVPGLTLKGPVSLTGNAQLKLEGLAFREVRAKLAADLDKLAIDFKGAFVKAAGIPLNARLAVQATPSSATLESLLFRLHTLSLEAHGSVRDFEALETDARISLKNDDLAALGDVLPQHRSLLQKARIALAGKVKGAFGKKRTAQGDLKLDLALQGSDLQIDAALESLAPVQARLALHSRRLDVDALLKPFTKPIAGNPAAVSEKSSRAPRARTPATPLGLKPEQRRMLQGADVRLVVNLAEVVALQSSFRNVRLEARQQDARFSLTKAHVDALGATLDASLKSDLAATPPRSEIDLAVVARKLDLNSLANELAARQSAAAPKSEPSAAPAAAPKSEPSAAPAAAPKSEAGAATDDPLPPEVRALVGATRTHVRIDFGEISYKKYTLRPFLFDFQQDGLKVELRSLRLQGLGLSLDAKASTNLTATPPPANFQVALKGRKLDVDALMAEFGVKSPSPSATPVAAPAAPEDPGFQGLSSAQKRLLRGVRGRVEVELGEVLARKIPVRDLVVDFEQNGLSSHLRRFGAKALGANLTADATLDLAPFPPQGFVSVSLAASEVNVGSLARQLGIELPKKPTEAASKPDPEKPPAQELQLTSDQRKWLQALGARLELRVGRFIHDDLRFDDVVLQARVADLKAEVNRFAVNGFGGQVGFRGLVDLGSTPLVTYRGAFDMKNVRAEKLVAFVKPEHASLLEGGLNLNLEASGRGTTPPNIEKSLDATGTFALAEGRIQTRSISSMAGAELDKFIAALPIASSAGGILSGVDKLMASPLAPKASGTALQARRDLEKIRTLRVSPLIESKGSVTQRLRDARGTLKIENGRIAVTSRHASEAGNLNLVASVGLDTSLTGNADFSLSPKTRRGLEAQNRYARILFDDQGELSLGMRLGGSVASPTISMNLAPLRDRAVRNARLAVEREIEGRLGGSPEKIIADKSEAARKEAEKRLRDEASKRQAQVEEARRKAEKEMRDQKEAARKKAEGEATRRKEEARKKASEEAKKALKGFLR